MKASTSTAARRRFARRRLAAAVLALLSAGCQRDPAAEQSAAAPVAGASETLAPATPAATAAATTTTTAAAMANAPGLAVDGEGLRLFDPDTGASRPIPFGTPWDRAIAALAAFGEPATGRNEECEAGPLDYARWPDSLTLYGRDGAFVGWFADSGAAGRVSTAAGIGPGSTRQDLEGPYQAEVFESTLGTEFTAGSLSGLLDSPHPDSPITAMWAGTSCSFR